MEPTQHYGNTNFLPIFHVNLSMDKVFIFSYQLNNHSEIILLDGINQKLLFGFCNGGRAKKNLDFRILLRTVKEILKKFKRRFWLF